MNEGTTTEPVARVESQLLCATSIAAQQVAFASFLFCYPMLMFVAIWVVRVPLVIIWIMSCVVPLAYVRPLSVRDYFRSWSTSRWLFVLAGLAWVGAYWYFSGRDGTPVSWDAVKPHYRP